MHVYEIQNFNDLEMVRVCDLELVRGSIWSLNWFRYHLFSATMPKNISIVYILSDIYALEKIITKSAENGMLLLVGSGPKGPMKVTGSVLVSQVARVYFAKNQ